MWIPRTSSRATTSPPRAQGHWAVTGDSEVNEISRPGSVLVLLRADNSSVRAARVAEATLRF